MGGFYHGGAGNSDSYVVLAGGGYKSVSDFLQSQDHYKTSITAGTAGTSSATSGSTLSVPYVTVNANGHVTAYGTHTHTISGFLTAQDHYKTSPGAGTAGTSSATSGSTLAVPYVTVNANGHVTGYGTHTHTVTGFLTAHQSFSAFENYHNASENSHKLKITIGSTTKYCGPEWLSAYTSIDYGANGLQYFNTSLTTRGTASTNGTPTDDWYHIIRMNHANNGGYYVDFATCFHSWNMWYRRVVNGSDQGWVRILDSENSSVSGGGSSWGSSITVKINGTSKTLTIPSNPNTNTWRKVQLEGVDKLGSGTGTNPLNIKAGTGISITESNGAFTFACTVTGSNSVAWVDVTDKIHGGNEFNMVNNGYSSTLWFNYCPVNDRSGSASVSEYIFGNGNKGKADICANTVYPSATTSYYLGKSSYVYAGAYTRFIQSDSALSLKTNGNNTRVYVNTSGNVGIGTTSPSGKLHVVGEAVVGESSYTAPQSTGSGYSGTWIGQGWLELSATDPYIDFHKSKSTADFTSRLIHWNTQTRLKYENSDTTYSGYIQTCEGNHHNPVILGIFDLRRYKPSSTSWSLDNICGPCYFTLSNSWGSDVSYHDSNSYWTIPSNLLRVEINSTQGANYTTKSTVKAAACIGTVMTRWINNQPVVANRLHGDWQGCSVECLCTNKAPGDSLYYDSQQPGKYIYITGARPWGYDDGSNGLGMDQFRQTGNLSYQRVRFVVYGWLE